MALKLFENERASLLDAIDQMPGIAFTPDIQSIYFNGINPTNHSVPADHFMFFMK